MARVVKAKLGEDLRRINVEFGGEKGFNMEKLTSVLSSLYAVPSTKALKVRYIDEDGDFITITSDLELKEAVEASTGALRLELELVNPEDLVLVPSTTTSSATSSPLTIISTPSVTQSINDDDDDEDDDDDSDDDTDSSSDDEPQEPKEADSKEEDEAPTNTTTTTTTEEETPNTTDNQEGLPQYDHHHAVPPPTREKEGHDNQEPDISDLDYLANEFHYHRLIMATAFQDSVDKIKEQYNKEYRPRMNEFFDDVQTQAGSLMMAIEKTLASLKEDFERSNTAQEASKKFSDGLREIGTIAEPVMEKVRRSFQNLVSRLFEKKQPITITAPEIIREMETFSSPPDQQQQQQETTTTTTTLSPNEATESSSPANNLASESTASASSTSTTSSSTSTSTTSSSTSTSTSNTSYSASHIDSSVTLPTPTPELKVPSRLSSDFIYVPEEAFKYEDQLRHIQSMGFSNDDAIKTALLIHNGDINTALDSLMMAE